MLGFERKRWAIGIDSSQQGVLQSTLETIELCRKRFVVVTWCEYQCGEHTNDWTTRQVHGSVSGVGVYMGGDAFAS